MAYNINGKKNIINWPITSMAKRNIVSMVAISYSCINGHSPHFNSQPPMNAMPAGNLILSAATLLSGNTFASINSFGNFCNIPLISKTKCFDIQKQFLWPALNNAWKSTYQKQVISELKHSDPIDLCGDGRTDSPGHNTKSGGVNW